MRYIPGYEERYSITIEGRIWSHVTNRWLRQTITSNGYSQVNLGATCRNQLVHRLVALTYITNEENKKCVNHLDGNKLNNNLSNLEWCTHAENSIHANGNGLRRYRKIPISEYETILKLKQQGKTQVEIAELYKVGRSTIGRILKWATQTPARAARLAKIMEIGEW